MTHISNLPQHLQQRLRAELKPDESILWAGQPNPNRSMKSGFMLWLFFIPWTAFSVFWIASASGFQMPKWDSGWNLFPLFGLPFLFIGIGGLSAPLWLRRKARSTLYAITQHRAISIEGAKSITVKSYPAAQLTHVERTEHQDGTGDLVLRIEHYQDSEGSQQTKKQGFFAINNVRQVEGIIANLARRNHA